MNGVPCVASNLPGVRQPVTNHKMGKIASIGSSDSLADSVLEVLADPASFKNNWESVGELYDPDKIAEFYEELFAEMQSELKN
jgi:glycosyltransferase involved in cell wall biosynthesis